MARTLHEADSSFNDFDSEVFDNNVKNYADAMFSIKEQENAENEIRDISNSIHKAAKEYIQPKESNEVNNIINKTIENYLDLCNLVKGNPKSKKTQERIAEYISDVEILFDRKFTAEDLYIFLLTYRIMLIISLDRCIDAALNKTDASLFIDEAIKIFAKNKKLEEDMKNN